MQFGKGASALAVGFGIAAGGAGASLADVVVEAHSFSTITANGPNGSNTAPLSFSQFDASLGTLTGVSFSLAPTVGSVSAGINWTGGEFTGSANASVNANFLVDSLVHPTLFNQNVTANPTCSDNSSPSGSVNCSGSDTQPLGPFATNPVVLTLPVDIAPFIGGGTFGVDAKLALSVLTGATCSGGFFTTCSLQNVSASWSGTLTLTYTYTPTAAPVDVPEPATLAILGAGLLGLGVVRRRTHRI